MKIGYSKKITKNLGNYENVVIEINVATDLQTGQTPDELFYNLKAFVNSKIQEECMNEKNSRIEVKAPMHKTETNEDNVSFATIVKELKQRCVYLVNKNPSNKLKITNLLSEFSVSKIADLNPHNIALFESKLNELRDL
jgi:hypothetical protein